MRSSVHRYVKAVGVALVAAAMLAVFLAPQAGAASAEGSDGAQASETFHKCLADVAKLKNHGIFFLRESGTKCRVARQVAYGVAGGNLNPKGFTCHIGEGGNRFPVRCTRGTQQVRFTLEG